jgi:hypothetical protein
MESLLQKKCEESVGSAGSEVTVHCPATAPIGLISTVPDATTSLTDELNFNASAFSYLILFLVFEQQKKKKTN